MSWIGDNTHVMYGNKHIIEINVSQIWLCFADLAASCASCYFMKLKFDYFFLEGDMASPL